MEIEDFDLHSLLSFDPKGGIIEFMGHRILLHDCVAMGILRKALIDNFGVTVARTILTRLGYAQGWLAADYLRFSYPNSFIDPRFGPGLQMLQGKAHVREFKYNAAGYKFPITCVYEDSYEAEQNILQFGVVDEPVCWALVGYASGYGSRVEGQELYYIEHKCVGKGDAFCVIEGRPKEDWGEIVYDHLPFFQEENIGGVLKDVTTKLRKAERRLWQLQKFIDSDIHPSGIIANSATMQNALSLAKRASKVELSVVVTGESGVGKELIARYIHDESTRAGRPFIAVNCSAVAESLLESEFFGHIKGAFSGADRDRIGLFEAANGGTIFLDEIGEMRLDTQTKFLRVLQEKQIRRLGDNKSRPVDFRVIAATNRNLVQEVEAGRFRQDLFYRLCVIEIKVEPLRERTEDILPLTRFFLNKATKTMGRSIYGFSPGVVGQLLLYAWPGNARELKNVIERAVALCTGSVIQVEDLPYGLQKGISKSNGHNGILPLDEIERTCILTALELTKGDKKLAAEKLNISLRSLYRKLKKYKKFSP